MTYHSVFGSKTTSENALSEYTPEYMYTTYSITAIFILGSIQLIAAILSCVIQNKVHHLRHMPFSTMY